MNWDTIAALAELLSAIAVFITLIFLVLQMKQYCLFLTLLRPHWQMNLEIAEMLSLLTTQTGTMLKIEPDPIIFHYFGDDHGP